MLKKMFDKQQDLTTGNPVKGVIAFMVPMLLGNLAQQLYSTVDSIIVGKYVGDNALAAVGSTGSIFNLLLVLFMGISVGANVMVAQYFGAKDRENIASSIGCCIILMVLSSIFVMTVTPFFVRPMLEILKTPAEIIDWSEEYLNILLIGVAGMAFYNILCGVMRGLGDSISPLIYLLVTTVINIVLDLLFVAVFKMGVGGVAYATIIAQMISAVLCLRKMFRMKDVFTFHKRHIRWHNEHMKTIFRLGLPSGITQMIFSLSMIIMQPLTNSHGAMFIAANVIVMRIDGFAMMPNFSFGNAMTTFAGQNMGANRLDRVEEGTAKVTLVALLTSAVITGLILMFGKHLMHIFTDTQAVIDLSQTLLIILSVGYLSMAVSQTLAGTLRGAGDTMAPMWISVITTVIIRIPLSYMWTEWTKTPQMPNGDPLVLYGTLLISWVLSAVVTIIVYRMGKWKNKAITAKQ